MVGFVLTCIFVCVLSCVGWFCDTLDQGLAYYVLQAKSSLLPVFWIAQKLRMVFMLLNGRKKTSKDYFVTHENYMKFKFASLNKVLLAHSHIHLFILESSLTAIAES